MAGGTNSQIRRSYGASGVTNGIVTTLRRARWLEFAPMRAIILFAIAAAPAVIGSIAVVNLRGPVGFCIALGAGLVMMRDSLLVCMMLMRRWQLFGRELFLIEVDGRHRWVDARELQAMRVPCTIRRREFRPYMLDPSDP
jgi:hypothetical protein